MDQLVLSLLLSTLTEQSMSVVVGLSTSRDVWSRLETTFSHKSKSRDLRLCDELQTMKKHDKSLSDFSREFKAICDQLAAMGRPIDDLDKVHWFLRGFGPSFSTFFTNQLSLAEIPTYDDVVTRAENYEIFIRSMESTPSSGSSTAAFTASRGLQPGSQSGNRGG